MARRLTKAVKQVRLAEERIAEIEALVGFWPFETKAFMRARLHQFTPRPQWREDLIRQAASLFTRWSPRQFAILKDPQILTDWQHRFTVSGQTDPQKAWNKILAKEVSARDYAFLLSRLDQELNDIHVPFRLRALFDKVYRAHIRKEYIADAAIPKAPLILVVGPSGSGKTATVSQAIEEVVFNARVTAEIDLDRKKQEILAGQPFWKTIDEVDPELAVQLTHRQKTRIYKALARIPLVRRIWQKRIGQSLADLEEQGLAVDWAMVTPNDYQTALAGEPGNYLRKALGDPRKTAIRHIEEAHSAFGRSEGGGTGVERQQRSLIDTANIVLDEIISGKRDCLLIATSDQPERFDSAIYRRFVEAGRIIDMAEFWEEPENLKEVVRLELARRDIHADIQGRPSHCWKGACLPCEDLDKAVEHIYAIFRERSLKITPAYVRKLVQSLIEIRSGFQAQDLADPLLVRKAFELVASNAYGDLFGKVVDRMDRRVRWDDYVGDIKNLFSEMANNCLFYSVSEEKGVVLNGPPGSGKTFLVRSWLSENKEIHDISVSPSSLQNPVNPIDGAVDNLEKIFDIAKMIAPTVVFFDEGDALAPRRSASGGAPSDKLTNKFLNLIDGEIPLNRVFTVLTTNRLDILDPALIRSKRLKVMEISGHLRPEDMAAIVALSLTDVPLAPGLDVHRVVETAQGLCNTPADYTAFVEKARSLRNTEFEVMQRLRQLEKAAGDEKQAFVKLNVKTIIGILDAIGADQQVKVAAKDPSGQPLRTYSAVVDMTRRIDRPEHYPLKPSHLLAARQETARSPVRKGKVQLDEFLEAELSQEPQVGFIIGVGANDVMGVLLPIATSLTYGLSNEKVLVTGAVSTSAPGGAEMEMAVKMTQQSAQEALTLVKNYLQEICPKLSLPRLLGEFLDKYTIHHQLLTASYNVGGPSAGYALALNTLSALLQIPVFNDFGITGAPWTKGVKKGEVGGSVIIGGHKKKAEKVLLYLRRMYMPLQNYKDLEMEYLVTYWLQNKDILGVTHFGDLVPEVVWLGPVHEKLVQQLIERRIRYKYDKYLNKEIPSDLKDSILHTKTKLRQMVEEEILRRLEAVRTYLRNPLRDPHVSLEEIFVPQPPLKWPAWIGSRFHPWIQKLRQRH
jgi:SpoVK/Ycf46/Vps4 family AAA+-type ATPase